MIIFFYIVRLAKPSKTPINLSLKIVSLTFIAIRADFAFIELGSSEAFMLEVYNKLRFQVLIFLTGVLGVTLLRVVKIAESFKGSLLRT